MRVVILGPPGAGKGTQAEKLARKFAISHLSAGDLLRESVSRGTSLGEKARAYMVKGELVPDWIILEIVGEKMERSKDGFILDGFPRNISQAKALDQYLKKRREKLSMVINLEVNRDTIIKRLTGRLICSQCGKVYHIEKIPPQMVCQECGAKLKQRMDDSYHTINNRIEVYLKHTHPLIVYYKKKGLLKSISGEGSPQEVFHRILKLL
jgi:adenylate kinase